MRKVDEIYYKRLERIREELNSYLELNLFEGKIFVPSQRIETFFKEKKKGGVEEKFLSYSHVDTCEPADAAKDVNEWTGPPPCSQKIESSPKIGNRPKSESSPKAQRQCSPFFSMQGMKKDIPADEINIPEFLRKDEKYKKLDKVLEKKEETFSEMLLRLIDEKGLKDSDAYKRANIDRRLFSKIRGDRDYLPSKKTAISFCMALQLGMDEAKRLLETAGYALSNSSRFDLIIMYLIQNNEYNIHFANIVLEDYGEGTLSK